MTIIDKRKRNLIEELKDKEYRDAYVSSSIDVGVAFQIRALREQQELNQTQLAEKAKMLQERISALENPSHSPTLSTLKKLAAAFDVGLIVRFVPFGELVKRELNLPNESLEVLKFDKDPYFKQPSNLDISQFTAAMQGRLESGSKDPFQAPTPSATDQMIGDILNKERPLGGLV